jgi:hypothetical protein
LTDGEQLPEWVRKNADRLGPLFYGGCDPRAVARFDAPVNPDERKEWAHVAAELSQLNERLPRAPVGRNLILGMATNYTVASLGPFVRSLRRSGYADEVVLLVSDLDSETAEFLKQYDVTCQDIREFKARGVDISLERYAYYHHLLKSLGNQNRYVDNVFITDVRDVIFQGNPFSDAPTGEVVVYLEDRSMALDTCPINSNWLRAGFGDHAVFELRGHRISCSGTVLGTWNGILRYLLLMQLTTFECAAPARLMRGIDQGIHNVIIHRNRLQPVTVAENGEHVFTMGYVPDTSVIITPEKKVADSSGRVCSVLRQYDRHAAVAHLVSELYC